MSNKTVEGMLLKNDSKGQKFHYYYSDTVKCLHKVILNQTLQMISPTAKMAPFGFGERKSDLNVISCHVQVVFILFFICDYY